ncbi:MAG TPA: hypothetical protein VKB87_00110 [Myxococcaceae bacterium]|nr:hypothetical protein [Myxococcaceae bacterium]
MRIALSILVGVACAKCATYTNIKTARALDPGTFQFNAAVGAQRAGSTRSFVPSGEIGARYGVVRGFDIGLTLTTFTAEANATVQLVRSDDFDLALAPAISRGLTSNFDDEGVTITMAKLPLLIGVNLGNQKQHQIVLGPTAIGQWDDGTGKVMGSYHALLLGGTAAVSVAVADNFRILPLVAVFVPVSGTGIPSMGAITPQMVLVPDASGNRPVIFQGGLGFSFGNDGRGTPSR